MNASYVPVPLACGDEDLMEGLVRHDSSALEQIYLRHRTILRGVVMRVLQDEAETDDVMQDVLMQLWTRADTYSSQRGLVLGWLITLARRRALDRQRQRNAYRRAVSRWETACRQEGEASKGRSMYDREAQLSEARDLVNQLMRVLPPNQRMVVNLAFFEGLSHREIAVRTGLPLGTVKTRIELGRKKLAALLTAYQSEVA